MDNPDPTFPPLLKGHDVGENERAFERACAGAASGELCAGDLLWSRNQATVEVAIVLEPEVALETAVQILPVAMVAVGDCLGSITPPQVGVSFVWPNIVLVNGAPAGRTRAAAAEAGEGVPPSRMVVGLELDHHPGPDDPEPGEAPDRTWLSEEGCAELTLAEIIESYSRHFLTWVNMWNDDGFKPVHDSWIFRAEHRDSETTVSLPDGEHTGTMVGLDENGNLLLKDADGTIEKYLLSACFEKIDEPAAAS